MDNSILLDKDSLICLWDFSATEPFRSKSKYPYTLIPHGDVSIDDKCVSLAEGQYLSIPRKDCDALNINGKDAQLTVMAWIKRQPKSFVQCEAIAGMWNETEKQRQYCLFLNLRLFDSADQVCGHVSAVGGPTPGQKWCIDASIGQTAVVYNEWTFVAFTYDGFEAKSYYNGRLDSRSLHNPYSYDHGIFDAGTQGSDFTVGAVHRLGEMGNDFVGDIARLAVFDKALTDVEMERIFTSYF
ncbi:MAG: LamG domain-containing protein [Pedobacter sp.]|nr:MAG: LamG domain-containing protein [Pedobacter sp.]